MIRYVIGFMFNDAMTAVCMILKNRPAWQEGSLNGVGGTVKVMEAPLQAMVREFEEEAGVQTSPAMWDSVATLRFPQAEMECFAARSNSAFNSAQTCTDEQLVKLPLERLSASTVVSGVPELIQLSTRRLTVHIGPGSSEQVSLHQVRQMQEAMQEFVDRVDRGEVRSRKTYAKFKKILAADQAL